jgi:hypothetical protein
MVVSAHESLMILLAMTSTLVARIKASLDSESPLRDQVDLPSYAARQGFDDLAFLAFNPELEPAVEDRSLRSITVLKL